MRLLSPARRSREVRDEADDGTTIALLDIPRAMRCPEAGMGGAHTPNTQLALYVALRDGFRAHTVIIVVDGREAYRRDGVTTDPTSSRADVFQLAVASCMAHIEIAATPGDYVASLDLDVSAHPHLAISLVGQGTVSFETSAQRFT